MSETERIVRAGAALMGVEIAICTQTGRPLAPGAKHKWLGINLISWGYKFHSGKHVVHCPDWGGALKELENLKCQKLNS